MASTSTSSKYFDGIGKEVATFTKKGSISKGTLVKIHATTARAVTPCVSGNDFCGVAIADPVNDIVAVQYRGFVTVKYTGTAPTLGYCSLAADSPTKVKVSEGAKSYLVVDVDTSAATACILL